MSMEDEPFTLDELPDKEEYLKARRKVEFLAGQHGQGYTFSFGHHHNPEGKFYSTSHIVMHSPEGEWAGSIEHNDDGHVGHLYVEKKHRAALPALLVEATNAAEQRGWAPPYEGGSMSPMAHRMASRLIPKTTRITGGNPKGDVIDRYEN